MQSEQQPLVRVDRPAAGPPSLVLDAPHGNALSPELVSAFASAVDELAQGDDLVVLVESANPRAFMVGGDLDVFTRWVDDGELVEEWAALAGRAGAALQTLRGIQAVKVAVATGAAVGGGLELLLMCDHRIVAEGVALGFPEIRMGVYPAGGSVPSLVAAVGRSRALRMLLGGELMSSERALECGLVDEVLPAEQVRSRALELAAELSAAGASTAVLRAIRRELSPGISVKEIPDVMRELLGGMSGTELADRVHAQRTKLGGTRTPGPDNLPGDR